jgi:hypothetical protein
MCRHTSIKCSGACRCVGSGHRETARRARACLNTVLGILSLTGLASPATARTNRRPLTDLTTDKFMRFPYSVPIPWNFYVKDNCALSYSQNRWARLETTSLYTSPCACESTLMLLEPNSFKESWNSRVAFLLFHFPITNKTIIFITWTSDIRIQAFNGSLSGTIQQNSNHENFIPSFGFTAIINGTRLQITQVASLWNLKGSDDGVWHSETLGFWLCPSSGNS